MAALRQLTGLFSAEFAVRGFIERDAARALRLLATWTEDPDPHIRRLVSEGTRPRLPWGRRLAQFQADPQPVLDLLERLKDDGAVYVRRSVANNLNDIAKDHPDVVIEVCQRWARGASTEHRWIIRHATRTLVKDGHPDALKLLGFDPRAKVAVENLALEPQTIRLGEQVTFSFDVRSLSRRSQPLLIDYAVHHVKRAGHRTAKVFKLKTLALPPQGVASITRKHAFRKITTRTYYPGRHTIEILINGTSHTRADFDLAL
jgi:3-methyladenine DNA glycosylase AlkC